MSESGFRQLWQTHFEVGQDILQLEEAVERASRILADALRSGNKVLLCGNGGSAADAQHAAAEFIVKMERERGPLPAVALGCGAPTITAAANDYSFDAIFERGVRALGNRGDVLICLTTSGRSENIRRALVAAEDKELHTIALSGRDGGFTKDLAEVELTVPGKSTPRIQEWHSFLLHVIIELAEEEMELFA